MIHKHLVAAAALVLACSSVATASSLSMTGRSDVQVIANGGPDCGSRAFSEVVLPRSHAVGCIHTAADPYDSYAATYARTMGSKPAVAPVTCYGNGQTGPRIQMIYGYYAGPPNRATTVIKQFRTQLAPRMQAVINGQDLGRDLGLRFACTGGAIDIKVVKFPTSVQYASHPEDPGSVLGRAADYLDKIGLNREDRRYQILWDGWNDPACGVGFLYPIDPVTSLPVSPLNDGLPTVGGHTDPGTVTRVFAPYTRPVLGNNFSTLYSMIFNHAGGRTGPSCFESQGMSTVTPEVHELFHTLGAVQLDSPNSNGSGHCNDAPSVMCPGQGPGYGGGISNPSCRKVIVETLDCGMDDYWNPNPPAGSYLSDHLDIARSQFFGPQPQDNLTASPV